MHHRLKALNVSRSPRHPHLNLDFPYRLGARRSRDAPSVVPVGAVCCL